jgi:hypothetical protein
MLELIIKDTDTGKELHHGEYNCIFASVVADVGEDQREAGVLNYSRKTNNLSMIYAIAQALKGIEDVKKKIEKDSEETIGMKVPFEFLLATISAMTTQISADENAIAELFNKE